MAAKPTTTWADLIGNIIYLLFLAWLLFLAYDYLRPLFHGPAISYWQSVAIVWVLRFIINLIRG